MSRPLYTHMLRRMYNTRVIEEKWRWRECFRQKETGMILDEKDEKAHTSSALTLWESAAETQRVGVTTSKVACPVHLLVWLHLLTAVL